MAHQDFEKNNEVIMEVEDEFAGKIFSEENIEKGKDSKNDLPNSKKINEKENEPNPKNEKNITDSKDFEKNYQVKDEFAGEIFSKEKSLSYQLKICKFLSASISYFNIPT